MHMVPEIRIHKNRPKIYHPIRKFDNQCILGGGEETEEIAMNCQNRLKFYKLGRNPLLSKIPFEIHQKFSKTTKYYYILCKMM